MQTDGVPTDKVQASGEPPNSTLSTQTSNSDNEYGVFSHFTPVVTLVIIVLVFELIRRKLGKWGKEQVLTDPRRSMRPLRWTASVALVAVLAFIFDKIDVSQVLEGKATFFDLINSNLLVGFTVMYFYMLFFIWSCDTEIEDSVKTLRQDKQLVITRSVLLKDQLDGERRIAHHLNQIIGERWERLIRLFDTKDAQPNAIESIAKALDPNRQFSLAIAAIHSIVSSHYAGGLEPEYQLRVAYYEPDNGYLKCLASTDGRKANCIKNPNNNLRERFRLTHINSTECLAVHCSMQSPLEPILIANADIAHEDSIVPYKHLSEDQRQHIKSIAAFSCRRAGADQQPHSVLTLDCSKGGFFLDNESAQLSLRRILDEFSLRLAYERDITKILSKLVQTTNTGSSS